MNLKVKADFRKVESKNNPSLKGFADLTICDSIVIKDVAVTEREGEDGKVHLNFNMPSREYEKQDGTKGYINAVEIYNSNEDIKRSIVSQIRSTIQEAMNQEKPKVVLENGDKQTPIYSAEKETNLKYFEDNIKAFAKQAESEKYPSLRASGSILIGNVLRINDVRLEEYQVDGENRLSVKFQEGEKYIDKDGNEQYPEKVFPVKEGLRKELCTAMEEAYYVSLEKNENKKEEEQEEPEV